MAASQGWGVVFKAQVSEVQGALRCGVVPKTLEMSAGKQCRSGARAVRERKAGDGGLAGHGATAGGRSRRCTPLLLPRAVGGGAGCRAALARRAGAEGAVRERLWPRAAVCCRAARTCRAWLSVLAQLSRCCLERAVAGLPLNDEHLGAAHGAGGGGCSSQPAVAVGISAGTSCPCHHGCASSGCACCCWRTRPCLPASHRHQHRPSSSSEEEDEEESGPRGGTGEALSLAGCACCLPCPRLPLDSPRNPPGAGDSL